jgi:DNA-binding response OmpR family regulator
VGAVFFLSGLDAPIDIIAGISAGARHYLTKPIAFPDLSERLIRALGR